MSIAEATRPKARRPSTSNKKLAKPRVLAGTEASAEPQADLAPTPPPRPVSAYSVGNRVHHPSFGDGRVDSIRGNVLTVRFKNDRTREIREDFVSRRK